MILKMSMYECPICKSRYKSEFKLNFNLQVGIFDTYKKEFKLKILTKNFDL